MIFPKIKASKKTQEEHQDNIKPRNVQFQSVEGSKASIKVILRLESFLRQTFGKSFVLSSQNTNLVDISTKNDKKRGMKP